MSVMVSKLDLSITVKATKHKNGLFVGVVDEFPIVVSGYNVEEIGKKAAEVWAQYILHHLKEVVDKRIQG